MSTASTASALDEVATAKALRLMNMITGGYMPTSDPAFATAVTQIQANDIEGAAMTIAKTQYFGNYLARRIALQMQSPALTTVGITDSAASAFVIAHFTGGPGFKPSLSTIWSENATYNVMVSGTPISASALTPAQLAALNWEQSFVRVAGQRIRDSVTPTNLVTLPAQHVGGYTTLSDKVNDTSFSQYAGTGGTNLRYIEGIWRIATGLQLVDVMSANARPQDAPKFIPEYDPNFFIGNGQAACIACHGGGMSSINHGYSTVADTFDYGTQGLVYIAAPTTATMKSLGSDPKKRTATSTCNLSANPMPVCNPDSIGVDNVNKPWDLTATWANTGILLKMGWMGPTQGNGLNSLGAAIGQSSIFYVNFVKRVITEICPMGVFSQSEINKIADAANPYAPVAGTDDMRTIVTKVAAHASCQ